MTPCAIGNSKKTGAAESAAPHVGMCDITNIIVQEVHLIAHKDGTFFFVIWSFVLCLVE
jgi:hypothetical protein